MARDSEDNELVRLDGVKCLRVSASGRAIWCEHEDWDELKCIPQSIIHADSEVYKPDDYGVLVVPRWFVKKENLL
jgi:hypothetical protein